MKFIEISNTCKLRVRLSRHQSENFLRGDSAMPPEYFSFQWLALTPPELANKS
jgi:hypothetical protein